MELIKDSLIPILPVYEYSNIHDALQEVHPNSIIRINMTPITEPRIFEAITEQKNNSYNDIFGQRVFLISSFIRLTAETDILGLFHTQDYTLINRRLFCHFKQLTTACATQPESLTLDLVILSDSIHEELLSGDLPDYINLIPT